MSNRPRRTLPAVLAFPMTMIVSSVLVSGCGGDKLSDDAYGFIDLAPYYYDGSSASNPSAGLPREFAPVRGWVNGVRAEYYDFGLVGVSKKRSDGKLPDYAAIPPMYFFFDSAKNPLFSKPVYEKRTGLWHMRGGVDLLNPNPMNNAPKNVPYSVRIRAKLGDFQRPIVDVLQHVASYSGLWEIMEVTVPDGYVPDAIKSMKTLQAGLDDGSFQVRRTLKVINCPVLDDRQYVQPSALQYGIPRPRIEIWYRTKQGSCYLADGWAALGDEAGNLYKANQDGRRLNVMDVVTYTIGSGASARTTITAPVSKIFQPTASVARPDTGGTTDVRYNGDNVTEVLPRLTPQDPPGYRPIRWLWDLRVPQDPPYVPGTYRSVSQMDPGQMVNRLTGNVPFTKNVPLIGAYLTCKNDSECADVRVNPGTLPMSCVTTLVSNTAADPGGAHCDAPVVRFGEFCAPGIGICNARFQANWDSVDPMKLPAGPLSPDEEALKTINADNGGKAIGGYTCQPNTSQGGYCFMRCDADAPTMPVKAAEKIDVKYSGPDGRVKTDKGVDLGYDIRCGNIPGYKCLNPAGTVPTQSRVCLRQCDNGKPDTFNDVFCNAGVDVAINEKVSGNIQKGMACSTRGLNGAAACQWDPAYEPRDPKTNFTVAP